MAGIEGARLVVRVGADVSAAMRGLDQVSGRLNSFASQAGLAGATLAAGLSLPLIAVGKSALTMAADYETGMNLLRATTGASAEQMGSLSAKAKELGADMTLPATSAVDAGQAMLELAKAGLSVNDTLAASRGVLQLAAAGQLSNAAAAEVAANALNAFKLPGSDATTVANLLAAAANSSSGEVKDFADSLQMASAVLAAAGVPIQDTVAQLGLLANAGIQGSDAGTSLKQMFLSLTAPTEKAKEVMGDLGISVYDANGAMKDSRALIEEFGAALGPLTEQQRNAALATLFGSDAVRAANIVLMGGVEAFDQMREAVTKEGAAADLAGARMQGLGGAIEGLKSVVETAMLEAVEPFLGTLAGFVKQAAGVVESFGQLDAGTKGMILAFGAALAALGPLALLLAGVAAIVGALVSPVGLLAVGIVALGTAFASGAISTASLREAFAVLQPLALGVWDSLKNLARVLAAELGPWLTKLAPLVGTALTGAFAAVLIAVRNAVDVLAGFVEVASFAAGAVETTLQPLISFWNTVAQVVAFAARAVTAGVEAMQRAMAGDFTGAWEAAQRAVTGATETMQASTAALGDSSDRDMGRIATATEGMGNAVSTATNQVGDATDEAKKQLEAFREEFARVAEGGTGWRDALVTAAADVGAAFEKTANASLLESFRDLADGATGTAKSMRDALVGAASGVAEAFRAQQEKAAEEGQKIAEQAASDAEKVSTEQVDAARKIWNVLPDEVKAGIDVFGDFTVGLNSEGQQWAGQLQSFIDQVNAMTLEQREALLGDNLDAWNEWADGVSEAIATQKKAQEEAAKLARADADAVASYFKSVGSTAITNLVTWLNQGKFTISTATKEINGLLGSIPKAVLEDINVFKNFKVSLDGLAPEWQTALAPLFDLINALPEATRAQLDLTLNAWQRFADSLGGVVDSLWGGKGLGRAAPREDGLGLPNLIPSNDLDRLRTQRAAAAAALAREQQVGGTAVTSLREQVRVLDQKIARQVAAGQAEGRLIDLTARTGREIDNANTKTGMLADSLGTLPGIVDDLRGAFARAADEAERLADAARDAGAGGGGRVEMMGASGSGSLFRRASGGPVSAFGAYLVGERGPELLQMGGRSGQVIPLADGPGGGGGGRGDLVLDLRGAFLPDREAFVRTIARIVEDGSASGSLRVRTR